MNYTVLAAGLNSSRRAARSPVRQTPSSYVYDERQADIDTSTDLNMSRHNEASSRLLNMSRHNEDTSRLLNMSSTLSNMRSDEKVEALADFKKYFKEKHKNSDNLVLKLPTRSKIEEEFNKFYREMDKLKQSNPEEYKSEWDKYIRILRKADHGCMGRNCAMMGGKYRKSRKSRKSRKHKKSRKHRKYRKSRKH